MNLIYFCVIVFYFNAIIKFSLFLKKGKISNEFCLAFVPLCFMLYLIIGVFYFSSQFIGICCCFQNAGVDFGPLEFSRCYAGTKSGQRNAYGPGRNWELGNGSLGLRFQSTATATDEPVSPVEKFEYQAEVCPSSYLYCVACYCNF